MLSGSVITRISRVAYLLPLRAPTVTVPDAGAVRILPSTLPRSEEKVSEARMGM